MQIHCAHPHSQPPLWEPSDWHLQKSALKTWERVYILRNFRKWKQFTTVLSSSRNFCTFPSSLKQAIHHFPVQNSAMASHWPWNDTLMSCLIRHVYTQASTRSQPMSSFNRHTWAAPFLPGAPHRPQGYMMWGQNPFSHSQLMVLSSNVFLLKNLSYSIFINYTASSTYFLVLCL